VASKTLVFCSEGNPEALNPQIVTTTTGMNAGRPIFNTLVEFVPGSTQIVPGLAESWTISGNGQEYVFRLRRGVRFHSNALFTPTREMNADDVLFSLLRQWKEDHPYHRVSGARYDYFQDLGMPDLLSAIEKVDDYTVRIRLKQANAPFLANLAMLFNVIHSAEYAEAMLRRGTPDRLDQEPIGTGPFVFAGYQKMFRSAIGCSLTTGPDASPSTSLSSRSRPTKPCGLPSSRPANATSWPFPTQPISNGSEPIQRSLCCSRRGSTSAISRST
jgi:dipeptide transport system substrate-binding protein